MTVNYEGFPLGYHNVLSAKLSRLTPRCGGEFSCQSLALLIILVRQVPRLARSDRIIILDTDIPGYLGTYNDIQKHADIQMLAAIVGTE